MTTTLYCILQFEEKKNTIWAFIIRALGALVL